MRLYYEVALRSFRRATTYRSSYIAGLLTNAFFGAVISFVYLGLYGAGGAVAGLSVNDAISYGWIAQAMISVGGGWIATDISNSIRSGEVANDMARPWSFYGYWLSRTLGERLFNLLVRGSLTYLIGVLYFDAVVPSLESLSWFLVAMLLSMLVSYAFTFIVNMSAFWTLDALSTIWVFNTLLMFFSGFLVPLAFFPAPLAAIAQLLPFQAITSLPIQIFLGKVGGAAILGVLLLQVFWGIVLTALGLLVQRAAMQKLVVQGG